MYVLGIMNSAEASDGFFVFHRVDGTWFIQMAAIRQKVPQSIFDSFSVILWNESADLNLSIL